eukprot:GHVU01216040.1.p1 GENE.GHVU01216040.1~~GHVU01216040.1.p1  ORF type:complete len:335 (+),score=26.55 GHVU01216040.1:115-1119(+)
MKCFVGVLVVALVLWNEASAASYKTILNEDDITGSCTSTCEGMPTLYDRNGCTKLSGCRKSSTGWNRGFVRCDNCECDCEVKVSTKDITVSNTKLSVTEPDLYGTCTGTCNKRSGLTRTNFKGCQEVRDCSKAKNGWTRGWVRCDHCTCNCINKKYADSYTLKNVKYDLSAAAIEQGAPIAMAETIVDNYSPGKQSISRRLAFDFVSETSATSSHNLEVGLAVTVEGGATVGVASIKTSVQRSIKYGYTYTAGERKTEGKSDWLTANADVPGRKSMKVLIIGHRMKIDVPYTATLVTKYKEGGSGSKNIKGVYSNVDFANFRVQYMNPTPLRRK